MGVVVFAKVQGLVKSESPRTRNLYFAVVTFLTKIQNWCCTSKKLVKTQLSKKFGW